jgi:hypothetical protein
VVFAPGGAGRGPACRVRDPQHHFLVTRKEQLYGS